jgi:hypothetical protein
MLSCSKEVMNGCREVLNVGKEEYLIRFYSAQVMNGCREVVKVGKVE